MMDNQMPQSGLWPYTGRLTVGVILSDGGIRMDPGACASALCARPL